MILIFYVVYLMKLGASTTVIGTAMLTTILLYSTSSMVGGILSDRFGRKHSMLVGLAICAVVLIVMGLVESIILLIGLHFLFSISLALVENAQGTMVGDITSPEKMTEAYGLIGSVGMFGAGLGAIVGGFLTTTSYSLIFFLNALTCLIYLGLIFFFTTESLSPKAPRSSISLTRTVKDYASIITDKPFFAFCMLGLMFAVAFSQCQTSFTIYATEYINISDPQLGFLWLINTWIMTFFTYPISTRISKIRKPFYVFFSSTLLCAAGFQLVYFSNSFPPLIAFMTIFTLSIILFSPLSSSLVANYATEEERGRRLGFFNSSVNIGVAIAPFMGGLIMDTFPGRHLWSITVIICVLSGVSYLLFNEVTKRRFENPRLNASTK